MALYQVSVVFEADEDCDAEVLAQAIQDQARWRQEQDYVVKNCKISFTKFEKEAEDVAAE